MRNPTSLNVDESLPLTNPGEDIVFPAAALTVRPFGPGVTGRSLGVANVRGHGRNSKFVADPEGDGRVFVSRNQGDHHDACFEKLSFFGTGRHEVPIVSLSGYSMAYRDLFVRSSLSTSRGRGTGIKILGGQHYSLDHCQAEFLNVGFHFDGVAALQANNLNGEFCNVGLLLTGPRVTQGIEINGFYAEQTLVGIRSEGVSFRLNRGVFMSQRHERRAVELLGCQGCHIDQGQGGGIVYMDAASNGNMVIVAGNDSSVVIDRGTANTVRTLSDPAFVTAPETWLHREDVDDTGLRRWDRSFNLSASEAAVFAYTYSTTGFAQVVGQFYDELNREMFDHAVQSWVPLDQENRSTVLLPWQTNQTCKQRAVVRAMGKPRKVQVRFMFRNAAGSSVCLFAIDKE